MAVRITLDLDIQNPEEIIKAHKGQLMGLFSDLMLSKESKKKKINKAVADEIVAILQVELPIELQKEMVKANISIKIEENIDMDDGEEATSFI